MILALNELIIEKEKKMKKYYLAYGSNLNLGQMFVRCPNAKVIGTSVIEGYELLFKGSLSGNYLTIELKEGSIVPVGVFEIDEDDERKLDRYEGFPNFYYKKDFTLDVKMIDSEETKKLDCFVYIMHEERKLGLPSEYYVETCEIGYDDFGFNKKFLKEAIERSKN